MTDADFERELTDRLHALADRAPTAPRTRPTPVVERGRHPLLPAMAAAVVVAVVAAGLWAVARRDTSTGVTTTPDPTAPAPTSSPNTTTVAPGPAAATGWTQLPPGPVDGRIFPVAVWTGSELIAWGGETESEVSWASDGAALDPTTGVWRPLAPAPLSPRSEHVAVWTGTEMLVCCGRAPDGDGARAAAYDPADDSWRTLADPPFDAAFAIAVWTGTEMLVTGGADFTGTAAYDPATDTWRTLADPPAVIERQADAAWTGTHLVVWPRDRSNAPGLLYDPEANTWTTLPELPDELHADSASMIWTGDEIVVWGSTSVNNVGSTVGARIRRGDDAWRPIADAPLPTYDPRNDTFGASSAVWTGSEMLIWAGAIGTDHPDDTRSPTLAYNPTTDTWRRLDDAPIGAYHPPIIWTGTSAYVLADDTLAFTPPDPAPASDSLADLSAPVDLSVLSIRPNNLSLALADLRARTVHRYSQAATTVGPGAASGATITPRGDIAVWVGATIHVFAEGDLDTEPHQLTPSRVVYPPGIATELFVQPGADGDQLWVVQPAFADTPTIIRPDRRRHRRPRHHHRPPPPGLPRRSHRPRPGREPVERTVTVSAARRSRRRHHGPRPRHGHRHVGQPRGHPTQRRPPTSSSTTSPPAPSEPSRLLTEARGVTSAVRSSPAPPNPFPTVSRDGRLLVSVPGPDLDGDENHEPRHQRPVRPRPSRPAKSSCSPLSPRSSLLATWSTDGRHVILLDGDDLQILDPTTGSIATVEDAIPPGHFPMGAG